MPYLLDTNAWAVYLRQKHRPLYDRVAAANPADLRLCSVVKAELIYGAYRSPAPAANLHLLVLLFPRFASHDFDNASAEACGRVRADLASRGTPIGPNDLLIASIALANDLTLVTHNTREFARVPGLRLEDWEAGVP